APRVHAILDAAVPARIVGTLATTQARSEAGPARDDRKIRFRRSRGRSGVAGLGFRRVLPRQRCARALVHAAPAGPARGPDALLRREARGDTGLVRVGIVDARSRRTGDLERPRSARAS